MDGWKQWEGFLSNVSSLHIAAILNLCVTKEFILMDHRNACGESPARKSNLQPLRLVQTSLKSKKNHNNKWFILATSCLLQVPLVDRKMMVNKL